MDKSSDRHDMARRRLIAGAGGVLVGAAISADTARASTWNGPKAQSSGPVARPAATTYPTIASAPVNGRIYRSISAFEMQPESGYADGKAYGGNGNYCNTTSDYLAGFYNAPAGALLRDVEFYVYNNSGGDTTGYAILWSSALGGLETLGSIAIPSTGALSATLLTLDSSGWGPYPTGTKVGVSVLTTSDTNVQFNGARLGFSNGNGETALLTTPARVYDTSVSGGKFASNETRTVTLPTSRCPPGTAAVILTVTASGATANGALTLYGAASPVPANPSLYYTTTTPTAVQITVGVSPARQVNILSSMQTNVALDLVGTIA